ncbi:MAG: GNAT family N-acetyltransferase [Burkholderiales bacterium]
MSIRAGVWDELQVADATPSESDTRPVRLADWARVRRLIRAQFPTLPTDTVGRLVRNQGYGAHVLVVKGRIEGFCSVTLRARGDLAWLDCVAVDGASQGRGLGRTLIRQAEDHAVAHGYARMALLVAQDNVLAIQLYERLGYQRSGTAESSREGAQVRYEKPLSLARSAGAFRGRTAPPSMPWGQRLALRLLYLLRFELAG